MLKFDEALARLLSFAPTLGAERIALDAAVRRVLAEDVRAPYDLPGFDHSMMDGYAVRVSDFDGNAGARLAVHGEAKTGVVPAPLGPRRACRIFTGAPIPEGADAVVMQEVVNVDGGFAVFSGVPACGAFIRRRGEDLAVGRVALARGTPLRPAHVALAATCDRAWIHVARRPVVTIVATGDELRPPGTPHFPSSVPECNALAIRAMAEGAGATARIAAIVGDRAPETQRALEEALRGTDVLVTIGGASVGDHDLVRPCLEAASVVLDFWKVAMKPGKPLMVGRRGDTIVLGLPGNPASAMITFALFGLPLLRALQGHAAPRTPPLSARLAHEIHREPGRTEFARAVLSRDGGILTVTPLTNQASGSVTTMTLADALLCIPAERGSLEAGATVDVLPIAELGL